MKPELSVVVIAKNEETVIKDCLESVKWADEVILLDGGSTDETLEIAKNYQLRIIPQEETGMDYAAWHNQGKEEASGKWIFYVDADERVTPFLKEEIQLVIDKGEHAAYAIPRRNFLLGKELHFGGWYPDYAKRLFLKKSLRKWIGSLHEQPVFEGELGRLVNPMVHLQPEQIEPALQKSIKWSDIEAKLLYESDHPLVAWLRVLRIGLATLFERLIKKQGFCDGVEGWIESVYQSFHTMIVYIKLWEMQIKK